MGAAPKEPSGSKKASCVVFSGSASASDVNLYLKYYKNGVLVDNTKTNGSIEFHGISVENRNGTFTVTINQGNRFCLLKDGIFEDSGNFLPAGKKYSVVYSSGSRFVLFEGIKNVNLSSTVSMLS